MLAAIPRKWAAGRQAIAAGNLTKILYNIFGSGPDFEREVVQVIRDILFMLSTLFLAFAFFEPKCLFLNPLNVCQPAAAGMRRPRR